MRRDRANDAVIGLGRARTRGPARPRPARRPGPTILAAITAIAVLAGCGGADDRPAADEAGGVEQASVAMTDRPPALATVNLEGDSVSLAAERGEVVLLNVWATWCIPCRREIPELEALHQEYSDRGLKVVGLTVDSRAAEPQVRQFVEEFGMTYPVWWDADQAFLTGLGAVGVPVTILIDREGLITWSHLGAVTRADTTLQAALRDALEAPAT